MSLTILLILELEQKLKYPNSPSSNLDTARAIAQLIHIKGGRALIVGGFVRDTLLGIDSDDIDIEVFGIDPSNLEDLLDQTFKVNKVGKSFGVYKVKGHSIDIALPRTETKKGKGHKGFDIKSDPNLDYKNAAARRDFTINAISWDPLTEEIIDPYNGQDDLSSRTLRHTSEQFKEDPLRVLRAMQFIARFNLTPTPETIETCRSITIEELAPERIFDEWKKLIVKGKNISDGLNFLKETDWIKYFPELKALINCKQDPEWHPEGDVWVHTLHCMNAFATNRINDEVEDLIVGLAVLCHDLGKPLTTITIDGRIRSPKHDIKGIDPTLSFLTRMTADKTFIESVPPLVQHHMRPRDFYNNNASDSAIRRLANKTERLDRLVRVSTADSMGRPPLPSDNCPEGDWLLKKAAELKIKDTAPKPLIQGRHLINEGLSTGPEMGETLKQLFEDQLSGEFHTLEEGLVHYRKLR